MNIPSRTSLSMTLRGLNHKLDYIVTLKTAEDAKRDRVIIDGSEDKGEIYKDFVCHLDIMRQYARFKEKLIVATSKTFPVGSGLAGSAAAASALAEAFAGLIDSGMDKKRISIMARRGSGSAARSVFGGFVKLQTGTDEESAAVQLQDEKHWDLCDIIVIVDPGMKKVKSREGMRLSMRTCPKDVYSNFVGMAPFHVRKAAEAVATMDLEGLGTVYEADNILFRTVCMKTKPPLDYWSGATDEVFAAVARLRSEDVPAFAGTDAGPNVHILTGSRDAKKVIEKVKEVAGVNEVIHAIPGEGSRRLKEHLL
jgi:diphosphomevalonate decarboxylase